MPVGRVVVQHLLVAVHVDFTDGVDGLGLEQQEPGANRAVTVLEAGRYETVFHHGQLGAGFSSHCIGRAGIPDRVPGTTLAFTHGARTEQVHTAAGCQQAGLELVNEYLVLASGEADSTGDAVLVVLVVDQLHDEDTLGDVVGAQRLLGGLGDDPLVGFAVDHDLPLAGTDRLAAVLQRGHALGTVETLTVLVELPDRQAPLFEQVYGFIDVSTQVIGQVVTGDTHQVVGDHARVIGRILLGADVGVDCGQTLRNCTGAVHGGLVDQLDLETGTFCPAHDFITSAAACHTTTDKKNVYFFFDDFRITKFTCHCQIPLARYCTLGPD